jgi:hypothetical protein
MVVALLLVGVLLGQANAGLLYTTTVAQWLQSGFTAGDKQFSKLGSWNVTGNALPPANDQITVQISTPDSNPYLYYVDYIGSFDTVGTQGLDVNWDYSVTTAGPWIKDCSMALMNWSSPGTGRIVWSENVWAGTDTTGPYLGEMSVTDDVPPGVFSKELTFAPVSSVYVRKNLSLNSTGDSSNYAHLSGMRQDFSQVPEASTCLLFGLGLAGMGLIRRFRKR